MGSIPTRSRHYIFIFQRLMVFLHPLKTIPVVSLELKMTVNSIKG